MPSKTNENIVTVIQALLWIGAVSFLIWYSVIELQKVKDTDYLPPSMVDVKEIQFPSLIICPSVESLSRTDATIQPNNSVWMNSASVVNPGLPWDKTPGNPYYICPSYVAFTSPDNTTANCIDFSGSKFQKSTSIFDNGCDKWASQPQWQPATTLADITPWKTITADTVIELVDVFSDANSAYPLVALLYSDSGNSMFKRPTSFEDYRKQFSVSVADRVLLPVMATTNLYIKKFIRDDYPNSLVCDQEDYETQQDNWGYVQPSPSPVYPNCTGVPNCDPSPVFVPTVSTVFVTYDSLIVTTTCHLSKHPLVFGDVLGIVGGGIAVVLAITLFLSRVITWCATRGENAQSVNDNYKGLI
jgi:hypothetical protein